MSRPNFFLIGAPKSGTTALWKHLRGHPEVFMCEPKEPHYFAADLPGYREVVSQAEYLRLFDDATPRQRRVGEASVFYLASHVAPRRLRAFAPDARLIVLLRDPRELIPSLHAQLLWSRDEDQEDLAIAWKWSRDRRDGRRRPRHCRALEVLDYQRIARFGDQLERWFEQFPRRQFKIVLFDELVANPDAVYRDLLEFLELSDDGRPGPGRVNERKLPRCNWLADFTQRTPQPLIDLAMTAKRWLGIRQWGVLEALRRWNAKSSTADSRQTVRKDRRLAKEVASHYADDRGRLERLLDRNLDAWSGDSARREAEDLSGSNV